MWVEFNQENNNDQCLEYDDGARLNDYEAAALIERVANIINPTPCVEPGIYKNTGLFAVARKR